MRPKRQIFMLVAVPSQEVNSPFHLSGVLFVRMCVCALGCPPGMWVYSGWKSNQDRYG